jgi:hypothetical protein
MYSRVSFNRCMVQLEGHTVRCPIELLQHEFEVSEHVRNLFVSFSESPRCSRRSRAIRCIRRKSECADGS